MSPTRATPSSRMLPVAAVLALVACGSPATSRTQVTTPAAVSTLPQANATIARPTQQPQPLPLSAIGAYHVGLRTIAAEDPSRENRRVSITVWYPAERPAAAMGNGPTRDAAPDPGGAPYPLILSSTKVARQFAPYLVSRGFAWASVDGIDTYPAMMEHMFQQPLDILFALEKVASDPPQGLEGMINAERAGVTGYSFDGYNALALSGARIDPEHYLAQCPNPDPTTAALLSWLSSFNCAPAQNWVEFSAHAGDSLTAGEDGLWRAMTDERIRAVMPLAGEGWWLFGEKGLAVVDRPVLMIVASEDPLYKENALIFEHLGTPNKALISFVGPGHMMIYDPVMVARMAHFAAAFFGYHLQGQQGLSWYFSEEYVAQREDLAWGVLPAK